MVSQPDLWRNGEEPHHERHFRALRPPGNAGSAARRLSRRGNRSLKHALHLAALCQIRQPGSEGRRYFDRKLDEGKTNKEALCSLKRQISNRVYCHLIAATRH